MHAIVKTGYYPRSQNADEQTIEVTRRFNLLDSIAPLHTMHSLQRAAAKCFQGRNR